MGRLPHLKNGGYWRETAPRPQLRSYEACELLSGALRSSDIGSVKYHGAHVGANRSYAPPANSIEGAHIWFMINLMIMKTAKITRGGQISIPSSIRRRWNTSTLVLEDLGDRVVLKPAPDDPIAAARGALAGELSMSSGQLRKSAREAEAVAERRRHAAK